MTPVRLSNRAAGRMKRRGIPQQEPVRPLRHLSVNLVLHSTTDSNPPVNLEGESEQAIKPRIVNQALLGCQFESSLSHTD